MLFILNSYIKSLITFIIFTSFLITPQITNACSMYKVTKGGETIVGNNEGFLSPNAQL